MASSESFRIDLASRLVSVLPPDQLDAVLSAVDITSAAYDINRKQVALSVVGTVPEAVRIFLASKAIEGCSSGTVNQYRYKLIRFFEAVRKPYTDITANDIRLFLGRYKVSGYVAGSTLDHTRRILNCFFDWLRRNEYIQRSPMDQVEQIKHQPAERHPLTSYDLEVIRWHCQSIREKAVIDFLFSTGCRVSELSAADRADIDWISRSVHIHHGKGDKARIVFFNAESELTLRLYLESRTDDNPALFVESRNPFRRLSVRAVQLMMKRIRSRCSVSTKATPHVLRHTFATASIRSGMPLEQLQALMGHSKPETTMIYAKVDTTELQRIHQRIFA